jgi:hypothetical protein
MEHPLQEVEPQFKRYLFVLTYTAGKAFADRPFHLVLTCN